MSDVSPVRAARVGVFGGAMRLQEAHVQDLARRVGRCVAGRGCTMITGATGGAPYLAGRAALEAGGTVLGISPASDADEHTRAFRKPLDGCSQIFFTGLGYTGRNHLNVRNCDVALFISGEAGTLEEYCVGVYHGLPLGAFVNSGGICELLPTIVGRFENRHGAECLFGTDPEDLLTRLLDAWRARHSRGRSEHDRRSSAAITTS